MLKFRWNALRQGDAVLVHDATDPDFRLLHGNVVIVDTVVGNSNDLAIRVDTPASHVTRPARHLDPFDPDEDCWRCDICKQPGDSGPRPAGTQAA